MAVADEIKAANGRFADCLRRRDAGGIAGLYASEARLLPPRSDFVQGAEAIRNFWQRLVDAGVDDGTLETLELDSHGDTTIEVGTYVMRAGGNVTDRGKYIVVWKKENGAWRLHRDMWNSSVPK